MSFIGARKMGRIWKAGLFVVYRVAIVHYYCLIDTYNGDGNMAMFTFDGLGIVQTRELPSGDLAIWHPLSEGLRAVVEPICRGRGHWKAEFKNWIVFKGFAHVVLADLGRHGKEIG